jgi:hypothetical protein
LVAEAIDLRIQYENGGNGDSTLEVAAEKISAYLDLIESEGVDVPPTAWSLLTLPFEVQADYALLDRATTILKRIMEEHPEGHQLHTGAVLAYVNALSMRAEHTGKVDVRVELFELCDSIVKKPPTNLEQFGSFFLHMQRCLRNPYNSYPSEQLKMASGFGQIAMSLFRDERHPMHPVATTEWAISARMEFETLDAKSKQYGPRLLKEALKMFDDALKHKVDRLYRPWILTHRAVLLRHMSLEKDELEQLPLAMDGLIDALLALPPRSPERAYPLISLVTTLDLMQLIDLGNEERSMALARGYLEEADTLLPHDHLLRPVCDEMMKRYRMKE